VKNLKDKYVIVAKLIDASNSSPAFNSSITFNGSPKIFKEKLTTIVSQFSIDSKLTDETNKGASEKKRTAKTKVNDFASDYFEKKEALQKKIERLKVGHVAEEKEKKKTKVEPVRLGHKYILPSGQMTYAFGDAMEDLILGYGFGAVAQYQYSKKLVFEGSISYNYYHAGYLSDGIDEITHTIIPIVVGVNYSTAPNQYLNYAFLGGAGFYRNSREEILEDISSNEGLDLNQDSTSFDLGAYVGVELIMFGIVYKATMHYINYEDAPIKFITFDMGFLIGL